MANKTSSSTKTQRKTSNGSARRRTAGKSRKKKGGFFSRVPHWLRWTLGIGLAAFYIVMFYNYFVSPYSVRWKALYGEVAYPDGFDVRGIDISHYQDEIDWEKIRNASINGTPLTFAIIKATEGTTIMDANFNDNFYKSRENGLIRGAYHFFIPSVSAEQQAKYFMKQVHLETGDLPPVLDIERSDGMTVKELQKVTLKWLNLVEKEYNVKPIIYTSYKFKLQYLSNKKFDVYPYWIAHYYVDSLTYKGPWAFWQHTDCGKVNGIKGHVDLNIFNGSLDDLQKLTIQREESIESVDSLFQDEDACDE